MNSRQPNQSLPVMAFASAADWREWLAKHHRHSQGIWITFKKKKTGNRPLVYAEARDQALCYGWIDSIIKRHDEESYLQKFTPRRNRSKWSVLNLSRMKALIQSGAMTVAGLSVLEPALLEGSTDKAKYPGGGYDASILPAELETALDKDKDASEYFGQLAPSHRKQYILWIASAKQEATRLRRTKEAISLLRNKQKLGLR